MSETTDPTPAPDPAVDPAPTEPVVAVEADLVDTAPEPDAVDPDPAADPKPKPADRRFAQVTARLNAESARAAAAEARASAAEALLNAQHGGDDTNITRQPQLSEADIEAKASELIAQRELAAKRESLIARGTKELGGADVWQEKTSTLAALGAFDNKDFLPALMELDNAPKIIADLADDPDLLVSLLGKSTAAMAAQLGRMDAKASVTAAPAANPISRAPRPVTPLSAPVVAPEPDVYDSKLTMAEYVALRRKQAPRHLDGDR